MERLWAPWRAAYILGAADEQDRAGKQAGGGCIFCDKPARGPAHHAEELILCTTPEAFVIMNLYPYNSGHIMVVPHTHVPSPAQLPPAEHDALYRLVTASLTALTAAVAPHGVNVGMNVGRVAGAGIAEHCHVHLVPRWNGDNNFMPVLGDTRVISQSLAATYATLLPHFAPLGR